LNPKHDGGANVGDDQKDLEQRAQGHARVRAGAEDVVSVVQHRALEKQRRWDRRDKSDHEEAPAISAVFLSEPVGWFADRAAIYRDLGQIYVKAR
jgi:hypothetical protein